MIKNQSATSRLEFDQCEISTLLQNGDRPLYTLTLSQFEAIMKHWFSQSQSTTLDLKTTDCIHYLTRKEAAELLRISLPTLNRYTQLGIINAKRVGTRILYSLDEIEAACTTIGGYKYQRS